MVYDDDNLEADGWEDVDEQELQDHLGVEEDQFWGPIGIFFLLTSRNVKIRFRGRFISRESMLNES